MKYSHVSTDMIELINLCPASDLGQVKNLMLGIRGLTLPLDFLAVIL